jgi:uncharacterized protein YkwD
VSVLPAAAASASTARATVDTLMLRELNRIRASAALPLLRLDLRMSRHAVSHAREMARTRVLAHGPWDERVARSSGRSPRTGEVIGWLTRTLQREEAAALARAWLDSPTHRSVLLDAGFRRIGVGRATGTLSGAPTTIYTVDFAAPR